MSKYTQHEKLKKVADKSQAIYEFISWLGQNDIVLAAYGETEHLHTTTQPIAELLADHFDIDLVALEQEKRAMIAAL